MKKLVPMALALAILVLLIMEGCQAYDMYMSKLNDNPEDAMAAFKSIGPEEALDEIYIDVNIMGINALTNDILKDKFLLETDCIDKLWGKYSDGRFGLADVYIIKPKENQADKVHALLEDVKLMRTLEFQSYDIYNSLQIAEDGVVTDIGDYVVLVMLEDRETAMAILEQALKQ